MERKKSENLTQFFSRLKESYKPKDEYQGVKIEQVEGVLTKLALLTTDSRDAVWVLLNNELPSLFRKADNYTISDGATTAHIGSLIGIVLRDTGKLDREGRDAWIKPLRQLGAIEPMVFDSAQGFLAGHIIPKSPNSCYRLSDSFVQLLKAFGSKEFDGLYNTWINSSSIRNRLKVQEDAAEAAKALLGDDTHKDLIQLSISVYAKNFLPDYILIYKDDSDGDRVSASEKELMDKHGIKLELEDSFPDVILLNIKTNKLWFIEAVTSDGEVDEHKMTGLHNICRKSNKDFGGATTTYLNWKDCSSRQHVHKNLADKSTLWIAEDPQKVFTIEY